MSFSKRFCAKNPFKPSPLRTESQEAKPVTKKVSSSDWTKEAEEQAHNRNKYTTDANIRKGAGADLGTIQSTSTEENKGAVGQMSPLESSYASAEDTKGAATYIPMAGVVTDALGRLGDGLETTVNKIQRRKDFEQAKNKDNPYYTEDDFEKSWGDYSFKNQATATSDNNDMNAIFDKLLKNLKSNVTTVEEPEKEEPKNEGPSMRSPLNETFDEEFARLEATKGQGKSMMQGQALDEVTVTGTKKKTRTEHRRDKTAKKIEDNKDDPSKRRKNDRLTRRKARLERKIKRQENKDKKTYAKKKGKIKRGK
tara:strand:+ start:1020 stop:1949 length:930 start_codon:yes stop_codon:yes gene_type:complete